MATVFTGQWGDLQAWPIIGIHSVVMDDGRVLTFGTDENGMQGGQFIYDIYDPVTGTHETLNNTTGTDIFCSAAMIIPGTDYVLIAGGDNRPNGGTNRGVSDVNILNMRTGELSPAPEGEMVNARWYPTMVSLDDGRMVMLGGSDENGRHQATPEIYTPDEGWAELSGATDPNLGRSSHYPRAFLDTDGNIVYFATGGGGNGKIEVMSINPDANGGTGSVSEIGVLPFRAGWDNPAVQFAPGKILIQDTGTGLWVMDISGDGVEFEQAGNLAGERNWSNMTTLPDGTVLINGGSARGNTEAAAEHTAVIWNPADNSITTLVDEDSSRLYHSTAVLLNDGTILSAGGGAAGFSEVNYLDAQIYKPAYLFDENGALSERPEIQQAPDEVHAGNAYAVRVDDASDVARVTLVKNGASTHAFNMGTGFVEADFGTVGGSNTLVVYAPSTAEGLSSGSWMMFIWDADGVPSIAANINVMPSNIPLVEDPANLLVNGSFEMPDPVDGQTSLTSIAGWTSSNGLFEVHGDKNIDANATHGQTALGLDGSSGVVSQDVTTVRGQTYDLSFTYETENMAPGNFWNIGLKVMWNGEVVDIIKPNGTDPLLYEFKVVGTGGQDTLSFEASAGTNALLGGLVDNVVLKSDGTDPIDLPDPVDPVEPTDPDPTDPGPTDPDPVDPDSVDPDPVDPDPVDPDPTDPGQTSNLLVNGGFETPHVGGWGRTATMDGWTSSRNTFEVWNDGFEGIAVKEGKQQIEVDSLNGAVSQSVQTEEGRVYDLSFEYELRDQFGYRGGVEVLWNGDVVATVEPGNGEPGLYEFQVTGTGNADELTFRATDDSHPSVAGILDNVILSDSGETVTPTDPDPTDPVDPDPTDPDPTDPDPTDPDTGTENLVYDDAGQTQYLLDGEGVKSFVVDGVSEDYGWGPTEDGKGVVIWDKDGFDLLYDFKDIQFNDRTVELITEDGLYQDIKEVSQFLTGTTDNDRFQIDGNMNEYGFGPTEDGAGTVVWQGDTFDILYGFEEILFNDGSVPINGTDGVTNDIASVTQYLTGTDGMDTFAIDGSSTDYGWGQTQDGEGVVVWGNDSHDILYDYEQIAFSDQTVSLDAVV